METLTVGQAATASGLTPKAVRLYEARGLIPPPERTEAGYRLYRDEDVATLQFIHRARTLGLTLDEIRDVLDLQRDGQPPCHHVLQLLDHHIAEVDRTLRELRQLGTTLSAARAAAADRTEPGSETVCRIIEHRAA